jgi:uncharacterized protein (DUF4213/DUF364 family)
MSTLLEQTRQRFRQMVEEAQLMEAEVSVLARPLTPEEAIGTPGRRDFPIIIGKERVLEATVLGARGQAFTDSAQEFLGTLGQVLELELTNNQHRAIYVATLNATLAHLGVVTETVHCKDEDPEECALTIARTTLEQHGRVKVGLIGLNPAIGERLVEAFGAENVRFTDLSRQTVGERRFDVEVWDGGLRTAELIDASDVVLLTGTTLVNGTFDDILERIRTQGKGYLVYGVTAAGVGHLFDLPRLCPRAQQGRSEACSETP